MQSRSKLLLAAVCASGLLLVPGVSALAQDSTRGYSEQQPGAQLDDDKLDQFVVAFSEVQRIREEFVAQVRDLQDRSQVQVLQQKAQSDMVRAVRNTGLSVREYNKIAGMMEADPELREKVIERAEQR